MCFMNYSSIVFGYRLRYFTLLIDLFSRKKKWWLDLLSKIFKAIDKLKDVVISNFTASINIPSSFDREFCKKEIVEWNLLKKGNMNRSLYFRFIFALMLRFKHCRKYKHLNSSNLCSCSNDTYRNSYQHSRALFIHN